MSDGNTLHPQPAGSGDRNYRIDELVELAIHKITPEFVQQARSISPDIEVDELVDMKTSGMAVEELQQLKDEGFLVDIDLGVFHLSWEPLVERCTELVEV